MRVKQAVGRAQHPELGATVQAVAHLLLFGRQLGNVSLCERITLVQEGVGFGKPLVYRLGHLFAIAARGQTVWFYALGREVLHHTFGPALRQTQVVAVISALVAMGSQLNGDVRIFVQHTGQTVECFTRGFAQFGTVESIEHVAHKHGHTHAGQGELQHMLLFGRHGIGLQLGTYIEIALAGGQKQVGNTGFQRLLKRTVAQHAELLVRTVAAYHVNFGGRQFIAILLIDPALHRLEHFGIGKGVDAVPTAAARTAARTEIASIVQPLEGDAKVIGAGVHRHWQVADRPTFRQRVERGAVEVKPSQTWRASVTRKVEFPAGSEGREAFVARRIDVRPQVLQSAEAMAASRFYAPEVEPTLTAWQVGSEIKPLPVGRQCRMGIARQRVGRQLQLRGLSPFGIRAAGLPYLGHARILRICAADREIHGLAVGRQHTGTFVKVGIQLALDRFGSLPLSALILFAYKDVAVLRGGNKTDVSRSLRSCRREVKQATRIVHPCRAVVGPRAGEPRGGFDLIGRSLAQQPLRQPAVVESLLHRTAVRHRVGEGQQQLLGCLRVALLHQRTSQFERSCAVSGMVAQRIAIRAYGPCRMTVMRIGAGHLQRNASAQCLLLGRCLGVGALVLPCRLGIFAQRPCSITAPFALFGTATRAERSDCERKHSYNIYIYQSVHKRERGGLGLIRGKFNEKYRLRTVCRGRLLFLSLFPAAASGIDQRAREGNVFKFRKCSLVVNKRLRSGLKAPSGRTLNACSL